MRVTTKRRFEGLTRRAALGRLGAAAAAGAVLSSGVRAVTAQETTSREGHPLVGSWIITGPSGSPDAVNSFNSDGIAQTSGRSGFGQAAAGFQTSAAVGFGVWEPTSPTTASFSWIVPTRDDQNNALNIHFIGNIDIAEDGQSFESQVVLDVQTPDGTTLVVFPNMVHGDRLVLEPMPAVPGYGATPAAG